MTDQLLSTISRVQELFDAWRALGSRRLCSGTELITRIPDGDGFAWLHVLFTPMTRERLRELEAGIGRPLPRELRMVYAVMGGMSLFGGMFRLCGMRQPYTREWDLSLQPSDLLELNQELSPMLWKTDDLVAFAVNGWDMSVHAFGAAHGSTIVRLDRGTGEVIERHDSVWDLLDAKLHRLDELSMR